MGLIIWGILYKPAHHFFTTIIETKLYFTVFKMFQLISINHRIFKVAFSDFLPIIYEK